MLGNVGLFLESLGDGLYSSILKRIFDVGYSGYSTCHSAFSSRITISLRGKQGMFFVFVKFLHSFCIVKVNFHMFCRIQTTKIKTINLRHTVYTHTVGSGTTQNLCTPYFFVVDKYTLDSHIKSCKHLSDH